MMKALTTLLLLVASSSLLAEAPRPNFLIIFIDDMGYGDPGCFGGTAGRTPRIDKRGGEGTRFTSCYAQTVGGPSRGALMTGRYPHLIGGGWKTNADEIMIPEVLKTVGYKTGCVGKWDMSRRRYIEDLVPNAQGFDEYFGPLGANDRNKVTLWRDREKLETTEDMAGLTRLYTDESIKFLEKHKDEPFFLYVAHTMMHVVIDATEKFRDRSGKGLYADTLEELDHEIGRLLGALEKLGLSESTVVLFTSDNGPWSNDHARQHAKNARYVRWTKGPEIPWGSSGPLRGAKGSTWEGGIRVPTIVRWPGRVPAGRSNDAIVSTLDVLPTFAALAGAKVPTDRIIDGVDQRDLLVGRSQSGARDQFLYYEGDELQAVRSGPWKLRLPGLKRLRNWTELDRGSQDAMLFHLVNDIGESKDLAKEKPDVVQRLTAIADKAKSKGKQTARAKDFHLYFLGGQSNMVGFGKTKDLNPGQRSTSDVWIYHGNTILDGKAPDGRGVWARLRPGHGTEKIFDANKNANAYSDGFGAELSFGRHLKKLYPKRNIAILKYARNGSSIAASAAGNWGCWDPDFQGGKGINQFDHFVETWKKARAVKDIDGDGAADRIIPAGIVWMQGESDAHNSEAVAKAYSSNLEKLMSRIRAELEGEEIPIVLGRISRSSDAKAKGYETPANTMSWKHSEILRAQQAAFCEADPRASLVTTTDGYGYSDPWHYDSPGYWDLGIRFAKAIRSLESAPRHVKLLPRSSPESQGVSSATISKFLREADEQFDGMHGLVIVRHGHVIAEGSWAPYDFETPHMLYSLSKSFTSTAVGLAIAEGKMSLDDKVIDYFPKDVPKDASWGLKAMRLRDLLRMSTGHEKEPALFGGVADEAKELTWVQRFLAQPVPFKPGTHFKYNTAATYMQSAMVQKATGQTVLDYLRPRLLDPLGFRSTRWMESPEGISVGGFGFYATALEIARFGQLYLQKGKWKGKQLIPESWVNEATSLQTSNGSSPNSDWDQGYGYQFWRSRHGYRGDGAFGQFCLVLPKQEAVIAITSGISDMGSVMSLVWDKLLPAMGATALEENADAHRALQKSLSSLGVKVPTGRASSPLIEKISGKTYRLESNDLGIEQIVLHFKGDTAELKTRTKDGTKRTPIGFDSWKRSRGTFTNGIGEFLSVPDHPKVAARGSWIQDDVLGVRIALYETPFKATLKLRFDGDDLMVESKLNAGFGGGKRTVLQGAAD